MAKTTSEAQNEATPFALQPAVGTRLFSRGPVGVPPADQRPQGAALEQRSHELDGLGVPLLLAKPDGDENGLAFGCGIGLGVAVDPEADLLPVGLTLERAKDEPTRAPPNELGDERRV